MKTKSKPSIDNVGKAVKPTLHLPPKSREHLCDMFNYDPEDGRLLRKNGKEAGSRKCRKRDGHRSTIQVCLSNGDGTWNLHSAHRIIYQMMGVDVPGGMVIDHINNDPWDNRWSNLRLVTQRENCRNRGAAFSKAGDTPRCIFPVEGGRFIVHINSGSKPTVEDAVKWRDWAQSTLAEIGLYRIPTSKSLVRKGVDLPRSIYRAWSGGQPKFFECRITRCGFDSVEEATDWRNRVETILFGEVLHKSST